VPVDPMDPVDPVDPADGGSLPGPGAGTLEPEQFAEVAESLRRELEGAHAARQLRAVIEQAKGILVQRHGISLNEAFGRLRELSQEHNVKLTEVAATIVGVALPEEDAGGGAEAWAEWIQRTSGANSAAWARFRDSEDVRARVATTALHAMSTSVGTTHEANWLLRALAEPVAADRVALYRLAAEGTLRLSGWYGYPEDLIRGWGSIPPDIEVPPVRAVLDRSPVVLASAAERRAAFPALARSGFGSEAMVCVPLIHGHQVTGVLVLEWSRARPFGDDGLRHVSQIGRAVAASLAERAPGVDSDVLWLRAVLNVLFDPWLLLEPVPGSRGGATLDFRITGASRLWKPSPDVRGRRLLELWPGLATTRLFSDLRRVEQVGGAWDETIDAGEADGLPLAEGRVQIRLVRIGARVVLHWRPEPPTSP
jgi:GAF domain-containing protein